VAEQYGRTPPEDWCSLVDRTDDERLELAMINIRQRYLDHPPTLPQFAAAIPARQTADRESVVDRLAQHAARLPLCDHQMMGPWSYFGPMRRDHEGHLQAEVRGVVVAACHSCGCPTHRVSVNDLPAAVAA
jgi:hypothetical protein